MKRVLHIVGINFGLFLAGIVIVEMWFGSWVSGPDYGIMNLPRNENRIFDTSDLYGGGGLISYTRDQYGLRGSFGADPATIDVIVIGGSTTNERYVDDHQTWVEQLENLFRDDGNPISIANAAIDGQSSAGHIATLENWLPKIPGLNPRYVLLYLGINDVAIAEVSDRAADEITSPEKQRRFRQYIMNHSALYAAFRTIRGSLQARRTMMLHGSLDRKSARWVPVKRPTEPDDLRQALGPDLSRYRKRLERIVAIVRSRNAEPIFITQQRGDYDIVGGQMLRLVAVRDSAIPDRASDQDVAILHLFNETTLAVCRTFDLDCVDLASQIDFNDGDFYDAIHTAPSGSRKIAVVVHEALKDRLKPRAKRAT